MDLIPSVHLQGDVRRIARAGLAYNSGLARTPGGLRLATRGYDPRRGRCTIDVCRLEPGADGWGSTTEHSMRLPQDDIAELEDCRLIEHNGRTYAAYTEGRYTTTPYLSIQRLARLRTDLTFDRAIPLDYGRNGRLSEKNWQFFSHDGRLHFIYSTSPHVVVEIDERGRVTREHRTGAALRWPYGSLAGGTPPVRVGDEYVSFFHGYIRHPSRNRRYVMGAYAFEAKPPFAITRISPALLRGSANDPAAENHKSASWKPLVIFPTGALREADGGWLVTAGVNDCYDAVCRWTGAEIDRALRPVAEWRPDRAHYFLTENPSMPIWTAGRLVPWERSRARGVLRTTDAAVIAEVAGRLAVEEIEQHTYEQLRRR